jgi:hypothetical protein
MRPNQQQEREDLMQIVPTTQSTMILFRLRVVRGFAGQP